MKLKPLHDHVVVVRDEAEKQSKGGILLPDGAKEKPQRGKVVAIGEGRMLDSGERAAMDVKPDDKVLFTTYAGNEVEIDGERYLILSEAEILAVLSQ